MMPAIQIQKPDSVLARDTVSGMQGGLGKIIAKETECINLYDPQLTLNGLRLIYERIKK